MTNRQKTLAAVLCLVIVGEALTVVDLYKTFSGYDAGSNLQSPAHATTTPSRQTSVYLGSYEGKDALFLREDDRADGYVAQRNGGGWPNAPFDSLKNPVEVFSTSTASGDLTLRGFDLNADRTYLYISFVSGNIYGPKKEAVQLVYKIDLKTLESREAYKHYFPPDYPTSLSMSRVVGDDYLVMTYVPCDGCDDPVPTYNYAIIYTGPSKFRSYYYDRTSRIHLHKAGDLRFDLAAKTVTFKHVAPLQVPCLPEDYNNELVEICSPGQKTKTEYRPAGKDQVAVLPGGPARDELPPAGLSIDGTEIHDNVVYLMREKNLVGRLSLKQFNTPAVGVSADLSPNKRFILLGQWVGDGGMGWVYDVATGKLHSLETGLSAVKPNKWLEDSRLETHSGYILADSCFKYRSVSSEAPWVLERVD